MGNKRIYEVAKDYGKPVNEVIDLLKKNNIEKLILVQLMTRLCLLSVKHTIKNQNRPNRRRRKNVMSANRLLLRVRRIQLKEMITI